MIPVDLVPGNIIEAIRNYGILLQAAARSMPPIIAASAAGSVTYDSRNGTLYYGASGIPYRHALHGVLRNRIVPMAALPGAVAGTLVLGRTPTECAEPMAVNWALHSGAREADLQIWTFRISDMRPLLRCDNCRHSVPDGSVGVIWTG
jgi:hypothetical protein